MSVTTRPSVSTCHRAYTARRARHQQKHPSSHDLALCHGRACATACTYDFVVTGFTEELSTVDGQNLAPLSVEGRVPSRSHFNIGACAVVCWLGGANGQNLAPPRLLPNIESGGKGGEDNGSLMNDAK